MRGILRFSDDSPAEGQFINIENLSNSSFSTVALQTDGTGQFKVSGIPGDLYRITAEGEEGHTVSMEMQLNMTVSPDNQSGGVPLYVIIAILLLLSVIPAHLLKRKP